MAKVSRYDMGEVTGGTNRLPNGWLRTDGRIARVGVLTYRSADGTVRREFRPPEEVFAPESLASFQMVPMTLTHPEGLLTAENTKDLAVGHVGDSVRQDGEFVAAPLLVTDEDAIKAIDNGVQELSCGYTADVEDAPPGSEWNGIPFTHIQRQIRGNHVAIVPAGRAGPDVRLRLDAAVQVLDAEWSAAAVNDLPDSAFLYVEPGGSKDEDGKTKPRSLRRFPVRSPDGKVDLPHLRNALARIPQSKLPESVRETLTKKAQELLAQANGERSDSKHRVSPESSGGTVADKILRKLKLRRFDADTGEPDDDNDDDIEMEDDAASPVARMAAEHEQMAANLRDHLKQHQELQDKYDALSKQVDELTKAKGAAEAKADAEKQRADKAEKAHTDATDPVALEAAVNERLRILQVGRLTVGNDFKLDAADRDGLKAKVAIIQKAAPGTDAKKLADKAYVDARFDAIADEIGKQHVGLLQANMLDKLHQLAQPAARADGDDDFDKKAAAHQASLDNAWKPKTT